MKEKVKDAHKMVTFELYKSIVQKTPVAEDKGGRARANWNISAGSPDSSTNDGTAPKYNSSGDLPEKSGDEPYYISNNLPYITVLEYGGYPDPVKVGSWSNKDKKFVKKSKGGFSKQAPNGMVGLTLANFKKISNKVALQLLLRKGKGLR